MNDKPAPLPADPIPARPPTLPDADKAPPPAPDFGPVPVDPGAKQSDDDA